MDEYRQLKRELNEVLMRGRTLVAEIGVASDETICDRHQNNTLRLCGILDMCDDELDRMYNIEVQGILDEFFDEYDKTFIILDEICLDIYEPQATSYNG